MSSTRCCPSDCALREDWEEELRQESEALLHPSTERLMKLCHLMSHPIRINILLMLCLRDHCVCELIWNLEKSHSPISNHLKILRDSGIIETYYRSNHKIYRLSETMDHTVLQMMAKKWREDTGYSFR